MSFSFKSLGVDTGFPVVGRNETDPDGNPAGGSAGQAIHQPTRGEFKNARDYEAAINVWNRKGGEAFCIHWQDGPINREAGESPNGALVEDVLEVCARRLEFYQDSPFRCDTNDRAIQHVRGAISALLNRRKDRADRGVLGKHEV